jgi:antitoxin component YwqK of YwqJK toxin-antitoxin module
MSLSLHRFALLTFFVCMTSEVAFGASAVAANQKGTMIYAYGMKTEEEAKAKVLSLGGAGYSIVASSSQPGYGAVSRNFYWVRQPADQVQVFALCGQKDPVPFTKWDIGTCKGCEYIAVWNDQMKPTTGSVSSPVVAPKKWEHDMKDLFEATGGYSESLPATDVPLDFDKIISRMHVPRIIFRRMTGSTNFEVVGNYADGNHAYAAGSFDKEWYVGDRVGRWQEYFETMEGKPVSKEQYYIAAKKSMFCREMDPLGNITTYTEYADDLKNGRYLRRNANGKLEEDGMYADDKRTGIWKIYNGVSGMLQEEVTYADDKKKGLTTIYYPGTAIKKSEYNYAEGKKNGICKDYYDTGKLKLEATYTDNERNGSYKEYYSNGNIKSSLNYGTGGILDGEAIYYSETVSGKITAKGNYESGRREGDWQEADAAGALKPVSYHNGQKQ